MTTRNMRHIGVSGQELANVRRWAKFGMIAIQTIKNTLTFQPLLTDEGFWYNLS